MQTLPSQHFCVLLSSITFTELSSLNGFKMSRLSLDSFFAVLFIVVFDINEKQSISKGNKNLLAWTLQLQD